MGTQTTDSKLVNTERGLTLAGTRITLYDLMDYIAAGWPPILIRDRLGLSDEQLQVSMEYIQAHRAEVEAEYRQVLRDAEESRRYWEDRNRERLDPIASTPPGEEQQALRHKLEALKAKHSSR